LHTTGKIDTQIYGFLDVHFKVQMKILFVANVERKGTNHMNVLKTSIILAKVIMESQNNSMESVIIVVKLGTKLLIAGKMRKNASKRPKNWKSVKESGGAVVDQDSIEYVMSAIDSNNNESGNLAFGSDMSINELSNEEYWVGDTGATAHIMNTNTGMINIKSPVNNESMVMGNGSGSVASSIGDIEGTKVSKDGNQEFKLKITNIMYSKSCRFNLFSISRMVNEGWKLNGDNESLKLIKGKQQVTFDIKVATPKGFLHCTKVERDPVKVDLLELMKKLKKKKSKSKMNPNKKE
jgi:hypothetical protein